MQQLIIIIEECKTLFCSSKFPWARERISSKFIENLGKGPQRASPLDHSWPYTNFGVYLNSPKAFGLKLSCRDSIIYLKRSMAGTKIPSSIK